jgi:hypothetical protein
MDVVLVSVFTNTDGEELKELNVRPVFGRAGSEKKHPVAWIPSFWVTPKQYKMLGMNIVGCISLDEDDQIREE